MAVCIAQMQRPGVILLLKKGVHSLGKLQKQSFGYNIESTKDALTPIQISGSRGSSEYKIDP